MNAIPGSFDMFKLYLNAYFWTLKEQYGFSDPHNVLLGGVQPF